MGMEGVGQHWGTEYELDLPLRHAGANLINLVLREYVALLDVDPIYKRQAVDHRILRTGFQEKACNERNKDEKLLHQEYDLDGPANG
jgi:hypothetical protein